MATPTHRDLRRTNSATRVRRQEVNIVAADAVNGYRVELTDEVHAKLVAAFRLGATATIAAGAVGLSTKRLYVWIDRGRRHIDQDPDGLPSTKYARLAIEIDEARHKGDVELLASVRSQATGSRCRTCQGAGTVRKCDAGYRADDRTLLRCPGCRGKGYARPPDGKLALELLGRRHVDEYGRKDRHRHEVTGDGGGPVRVDVRAAAAVLDVDLATLSPAQLSALAFGGDDAPQTIVSATRGRLPVRRETVEVVGAEAASTEDQDQATSPTPPGPGVFGGLAEVEAVVADVIEADDGGAAVFEGLAGA